MDINKNIEGLEVEEAALQNVAGGVNPPNNNVDPESGKYNPDQGGGNGSVFGVGSNGGK